MCITIAINKNCSSSNIYLNMHIRFMISLISVIKIINIESQILYTNQNISANPKNFIDPSAKFNLNLENKDQTFLNFLHQIIDLLIPSNESITLIYNPKYYEDFYPYSLHLNPNYEPDFLIQELVIKKFRKYRPRPYIRQCAYIHLFSKFIDNDFNSFLISNWRHENILVIMDAKSLSDLVSSHYMSMNEVFGKILVYVLDYAPEELVPGTCILIIQGSRSKSLYSSRCSTRMSIHNRSIQNLCIR